MTRDVPWAEAAVLAVKISEPLLRIELEETMCWTLEWANSEVMAVGCTNGLYALSLILISLLITIEGALAVYNIGDALQGARNPLEGTFTARIYRSLIPSSLDSRDPADALYPGTPVCRPHALVGTRTDALRIEETLHGGRSCCYRERRVRRRGVSDGHP